MPALAAAISLGGIQLTQASALPRGTQNRSVELQCPACRTALMALPYHLLAAACEPIWCPRCSFTLRQGEGIWRALPKEREKYFARFVRDYEAIRRAEGRGSEDAEFYLSLPFCDRTKKNSWQWSIRARTFRYIERRIIPTLGDGDSISPTILDLGAGNGWLSYRLTNLGCRPIAVDLQSNTFDGLGAAMHYRQTLPTLFPCFQAELDHLPFSDDQFDCAIFNASFHYSENYDVTLSEAIRCLRPGGTVVIADSPSYSREESGQAMLQERRAMFQARFGFRSDALSSCEYLTNERLVALEAKHDIEWTTHHAWYGMRWASRPLAARISGRREPSQFRVYTARVKAQ